MKEYIEKISIRVKRKISQKDNFHMLTHFVHQKLDLMFEKYDPQTFRCSFMTIARVHSSRL